METQSFTYNFKSSQSFTQEPSDTSGATATSELGAAGGHLVEAATSAGGGSKGRSEGTTGGWAGGSVLPGISSSSSEDSS